MGTIENEFIRKLESFLDTEFSPFCKGKVLGLLKEYRLNIPAVIIKKNIVEYVPEDKVPEKKRTVDMDKYIHEGCVFFGLEKQILTRPGRKRIIVEKRHMIASYLVNEKKCSLIDVGRKFNRDHTTIINSVRLVDNLSQTNNEFREQYNQLTNHLNTIV